MYKEKKKNGRITLTPYQYKTLMTHFKKCAFPDADERMHLSAILNITVRSVQIWFQNQRQKNKMSAPAAVHTVPVQEIEGDKETERGKGKTLRALATAAFIEYCNRAKYHKKI